MKNYNQFVFKEMWNFCGIVMKLKNFFLKKALEHCDKVLNIVISVLKLFVIHSRRWR